MGLPICSAHKVFIPNALLSLYHLGKKKQNLRGKRTTINLFICFVSNGNNVKSLQIRDDYQRAHTNAFLQMEWNKMHVG